MKYKSMLAFCFTYMLVSNNIAVADLLQRLVKEGTTLTDEQICIPIKDSKILQKCLSIYQAVATTEKENELRRVQQKRQDLPMHCTNCGTFCRYMEECTKNG